MVFSPNDIQNGGFRGASGIYPDEDIAQGSDETVMTGPKQLFVSSFSISPLMVSPLWACHTSVPGAPAARFASPAPQGFQVFSKDQNPAKAIKVFNRSELIEHLKSLLKNGEIRPNADPDILEIELSHSMTINTSRSITFYPGTRLRLSIEETERSKMNSWEWQAQLPRDPDVQEMLGLKIYGGSQLIESKVGTFELVSSKPMVVAGIPCEAQTPIRLDIIASRVTARLAPELRADPRSVYNLQSKHNEKFPLREFFYFEDQGSSVLSGELKGAQLAAPIRWQGRDYLFEKSYLLVYLKSRLLTDITPELQPLSKTIRGILKAPAEISFDGKIITLAEGSYLEISDSGKPLTFEGVVLKSQRVWGVDIKWGDWLSYQQNDGQKKLRVVLGSPRKVMGQNFATLSELYPRESGKSLERVTLNGYVTSEFPKDKKIQSLISFYSGEFSRFSSLYAGPCRNSYACSDID